MLEHYHCYTCPELGSGTVLRARPVESESAFEPKPDLIILTCNLKISIKKLLTSYN